MLRVLIALSALGLLVGCPGESCPEEDTIDWETDFDIGEPCFADYERSPDLNQERVSAADAAISHNEGWNCQECHQAAGPGIGLFTAAGTIYMADRSLAPAGTKVRLYEDGARQVVVEELVVDTRGNIYTTADLGLSTAKLFVSVFSEDEVLRNDMGSPKFNLSCNFCHDAASPADLNPETDDTTL